MNPKIELSPNRLVRAFHKEPKDFTRADIIRFIRENEIQMVNFMYPADDRRLKTLNFVINSEEYLENILTYGERVDGSSLFPFIEAGNSDLYVVPRYSTAFLDPFAEIPTLTMLASYFDKEGNPLKTSPEQTLRKACRSFRETTGLDFYAMGELEYYVISEDDAMFAATDQKGYHESSPYAKFNQFRTRCMQMIAEAGGQIKYGHSEVGNFTLEGKIYEQNEIEFLPVPAEDAADQLMVAKWIIRTLGHEMGYDVTFAPKITTGKAGSGLHIHFKLMQGDHNVMTDASGKLSDEAKKAIAGILEYAPAITAFGNKIPTSYFRLVPHQEAPTSVCWGDRNRSVLVRVPLGWTGEHDMCSQVNPLETPGSVLPEKQTVELRSSDCSADIYQLLAGMVTAAREGFENPDSLKRAEELYVSVNIHNDANKEKLAKLKSLPDSCVASAKALAEMRSVFEKNDVFAPDMIDGIIDALTKFDDVDLRDRLDNEQMLELVRRFWHCG